MSSIVITSRSSSGDHGRAAAGSKRRSAATGATPLRHSLDTDTPREAVTHFDVRELLPRHSLLDVRLETGRTHQIRVHLAAIDLPVAGDPVYGRPASSGSSASSSMPAGSPSRIPSRDERVDVESPLPPDLTAALERARLES